MIGGRNAAGKPIPPTSSFRRQHRHRMPKHFVSSVSITCSMCKAAFGHEEIQSFPISLGLNNKGGMEDVDFFDYL